MKKLLLKSMKFCVPESKNWNLMQLLFGKYYLGLIVLLLAIVALSSCEEEIKFKFNPKPGEIYREVSIEEPTNPFSKVWIDTLKIIRVKDGWFEWENKFGGVHSYRIEYFNNKDIFLINP